jgi:hypothetical protein
MKDFLTRIAGLRAGINGGGAGASLSDGTGAASAPVMTKTGGAGAVRGSRRTGGGGGGLLTPLSADARGGLGDRPAPAAAGTATLTPRLQA